MTDVVVIDDDADIARLLAMRLTRAGYAVREYHDGASGLDAIRRTPPNIAIVDWMMPGMDGIDVAIALRSDAATKRIPLIMVTARVNPDDHETARTAGYDAVLTKPFTKQDLLAQVDALCPPTA